MPLRRQRMRVELSTGPDVIDVEAINPDFLRVESEGARFGIPTDPKQAPMTYMTAVSWAALKRCGLYDGDLATYQTRDCVVLDVLRDDVDDDQGADVPPTAPGPGTG